MRCAWAVFTVRQITQPVLQHINGTTKSVFSLKSDTTVLINMFIS